MLKNIKSSYFIKIIFLYFDEKRKLKLLKYNKTLQNTIDISIYNYLIIQHIYFNIFKHKHKLK